MKFPLESNFHAHPVVCQTGVFIGPREVLHFHAPPPPPPPRLPHLSTFGLILVRAGIIIC